MTKGFLQRVRDFSTSRRLNTWVVFYVLVYIILVIKLITMQQLETGIFFGAYSVVVSLYILSRFALAYCYAPAPPALESRSTPPHDLLWCPGEK